MRFRTSSGYLIRLNMSLDLKSGCFAIMQHWQKQTEEKNLSVLSPMTQDLGDSGVTPESRNGEIRGHVQCSATAR
jgi:hypothetical protein